MMPFDDTLDACIDAGLVLDYDEETLQLIVLAVEEGSACRLVPELRRALRHYKKALIWMIGPHRLPLPEEMPHWRERMKARLLCQ